MGLVCSFKVEIQKEVDFEDKISRKFSAVKRFEKGDLLQQYLLT